MKIDSSWQFQEIFKNIKAIKQRYKEVLSSFSIFDIKYETEYIKSIKKSIYRLQISDWKKDRIWEYINDDLAYKVLLGICMREPKKYDKIKNEGDKKWK